MTSFQQIYAHIHSLLRQHKLLLGFIGLYFLVCLLTYKDFGITSDERVEYSSGKHYVAYYLPWVKQDLPSLDERHLPQNSTYLRLYPALLTLLNRADYYEWYHLLNLLFGVSLFILAYALLFSAFRKSSLALLGPLFILLTPRISGDLATNTKDIPFAVLYLLCIYLLYSLPKVKKRLPLLICLGVVAGLAQATRLIGLSFLLLMPAYLVIGLKQGFYKSSTQTILFSSLGVLLLSLVTMYLFLPLLHTDPIQGFSLLTSSSAQFSYWDNLKFFNGQYLDKSQNPFYYSIVWLVITIPTYQLLLVVYGLVSSRRFVQHSLVLLLSMATLVNIGLFVIARPVIYNGPRHFLYILVLISLLSAVFFAEVKSQVFKALIVVFMSITLVTMLILYPYNYVYFSEHIGGIRGAHGRFELDYWGASYSEASKKLAASVQDVPSVFPCDLSYAVAYHGKGRYLVAQSLEEADYLLCDAEEYRLKSYAGTEVGTISRFGVPLLYILKTN